MPAVIQTLPAETNREVEELRGRVRLARAMLPLSKWPLCFDALDAQNAGVKSNENESHLELLIEPWLANARSLRKCGRIQCFDWFADI
jgi:hypothetical protein